MQTLSPIMEMLTTVHAMGSIPMVDSSNMTRLECEFQPLRLLYLIPFVLITILAVPGNLLVMAAVYRERRLKTPTNVLVVGLSVSDLTNGTLSIPAAYFWFVSYCDDLVVLYFRFIARTCCACSVVHLVLISIDRYVSVAKPLKYQSLITRRRTRKGSLITMLVIIPYMFTVVILFHLVEIGRIDVNEKVFEIFWNYIPSSMILVAMVVTSIIYSYVFYQAHKLRTRMTSMMRNSHRTPTAQSSRAKQIRATKTLAFVVIAFAICWLPICIILFVDSSGTGYNPDLSIGPTMAYYANSIMNPLIYAHRSKDFRNAFKRIIRDVARCITGGKPEMQRTASTMSSSQRPSVFEGPPNIADLKRKRAVGLKSNANVDFKSNADVDLNSNGDVDKKSNDVIDMKSHGDFDIKSNGDVDLKSNGDVDMKSTCNSNVDLTTNGTTGLKEGEINVVLSDRDMV
nr:adenosine receptor A2b-like [Lytechinus pictus]